MEFLPFEPDKPAQSFSVKLNGVTYKVAARYNDRAGYWTLDLRRSDNAALVLGVPILIGQDLLAPYALGIGGLAATDLSGQGLDAGPEDLGGRVVVAYLSPEDLERVDALGGLR